MAAKKDPTLFITEATVQMIEGLPNNSGCLAKSIEIVVHIVLYGPPSISPIKNIKK